MLEKTLVTSNIAYKTISPHFTYFLLTQKIECSAIHKYIFFLDKLKIECPSELLCGSTQLCFSFLPGTKVKTNPQPVPVGMQQAHICLSMTSTS